MMDVSDRAPGESVMIALLPTSSDWSHLELPHLTLVYAGLIKDHKPTDFNELAKDTAMLASLSNQINLKVMKREAFGDAKNIDVFTLQPSPELWAMRRAVESWNESTYPFNPHVTIGPIGSTVNVVPNYIRFDRLMTSWGDDRLVFNLNRR